MARRGGEGRAGGQPPLPLALAVALALETLTQEDSSSLLEPRHQEAFCLEHLFLQHLRWDSAAGRVGGRTSFPVLITCYQLQRLLRGKISIIA